MSCDRLHAFIDGELDTAEAAAFREHLAGCASCRRELPRLIALLAMVETAGEDRRAAAPARAIDATDGDAVKREMPRVIVEPRAGAAGRGVRPGSSRQPRRAAPILPALLVAGLCFTAGTAVVLTRSGGRAPADADAVFAELAPMRSLDARVTVHGADRYRIYSTTRDGAAAPAERIPFAELAALERRGDWHAIGVAALLAGNRDQAATYLSRALRSPDVDTDRAAVLLARGDDRELEVALDLLDGVLTRNPRHGAAAWNRALVLARLELPLGAARQLDEVAALGESGWSDEARVRAAELRASSGAVEHSWRAAWDAGRRLIASGEPLAPGTVHAHAGLIRLMFYDAVRTAPTRARLLALEPLARELDGIYGSDTLAALVERVAALDFAVRAPLAATYLGIALGTAPLDAARRAPYFAELRRAGRNAADILLGALVQAGEAQRNLTELRALADATRDPWFAALGAHEEAKRDLAAASYPRAEARLIAAIDAARPLRIAYRTELLELELARVRIRLDRLPEARAVALDGLRRARRGGEWGHEQEALVVLAEVARHRHEIALARAQLGELLEREPDRCAVQRYVHLALANLHALRLEIEAARRELAVMPSCGEPLDLQAALILTDLQRFDGTPEEARQVMAGLAAQRGSGALTRAELALADEIEGQLVLASDLAHGEALLRRAIAQTEAIGSGDQVAVKTRAYAYTALILDAGRRHEPARALALIAEEVGAAAPDRCALGIATDDERLLIVARTGDGAISQRYEGALSSPVVDVASLIPDAMRRALTGCPVVAVIARPPVQGTSRLLPPEIAWSYRLHGPPPPREAVAPSSLIVAGVTPPPHLGLAALTHAPASERDGPPRVELLGPLATPSRVVAAAVRATEIELDVHGYVDRGVSDASYLVLSPEADGEYALTAAQIAGTRLLGAPLVILAACRAATAAPYLHEAWGLPVAFIRAGARAVMATPGVVEDVQAGAFFAAVRARVRAGQPPSVALRDERIARLRISPESWVRDVIVFEPQRESYGDHHSPDRAR